MPLTLDGIQTGQLHKALRDAFNAESFERMLLFKLNLRASDFVSTNTNLQNFIFETINETNRTYRTDELIAAAREANPTNPLLHEFSRQFGLTSLDKNTPAQEFQKLIVATNSFLDPMLWRMKLAEIENRVCRIEFGGYPTGTGFLVGSDLILTNHHVVESVIMGEKGEKPGDGGEYPKPEDVTCTFDYKAVNNKVINQGVTYGLATKWLVDSSPSSPLDQPPVPDCLDYALLRLGTKAGEDNVANMPFGAGAERGWISIPANQHNFAADSPMFIMQHPSGSPLKLALGTNGVIAINEEKNRVRHRVNTEPGSSGSPCLSQDWDLIALHHSGDPNFDPAHKPAYNEAIPMAAVLELMTRNGVNSELGK